MSTLLSFIIGFLISGVGVSYFEPIRMMFGQTVPYLDAAYSLASTGNFTSATCTISADPAIAPHAGAPVRLTFTSTNNFAQMSFNGEVIQSGYKTTVNPTENTTYTALLNGGFGCMYVVEIAKQSSAPACTLSENVSLGAQGPSVGIVQQFLIDMNLPITKTNTFDVRTEAALKVYQMEVLGKGASDLASVVTGVWDQRTRTHVHSILQCASKQTETPGATPTSTSVSADADKVCLEKMIRPRSQGDDVNAIQQFLQKQGFVLDATGFYGEKTKQAVKDFQEAYADDILKPNDLTEGSGIWGPSTAKKASHLGLCAFVK